MRNDSAISSFSFPLLNFLACDSSKRLILLQTEARMINSLSKLTKSYPWSWQYGYNPRPAPLSEIVVPYLFWAVYLVLEHMFWWAGEAPFPDETSQFRDNFDLCMSSIQQKDFAKSNLEGSRLSAMSRKKQILCVSWEFYREFGGRRFCFNRKQIWENWNFSVMFQFLMCKMKTKQIGLGWIDPCRTNSVC